MSLSVPQKLRLKLLLGLSLQSLLAGAALADPAPPFRELLRQAQATAPRLAEARAEIARAEGLARQAGAMPNPTLGVEVENFATSNGVNMAETTASIEQTIELGGKRSARIAAGRADVEAARRRAASEGDGDCHAPGGVAAREGRVGRRRAPGARVERVTGARPPDGELQREHNDGGDDDREQQLKQQRFDALVEVG